MDLSGKPILNPLMLLSALGPMSLNTWKTPDAKFFWNSKGILFPYQNEEKFLLKKDSILSLSVAKGLRLTLSLLWTNRSFAGLVRTWLEIHGLAGPDVVELSEMIKNKKLSIADRLMLSFLLKDALKGQEISKLAVESVEADGMMPSRFAKARIGGYLWIVSHLPVFIPFRTVIMHKTFDLMATANTKFFPRSIARTVARDALFGYPEPFFAAFGIAVGRMHADFSRKLAHKGWMV